MLVSPVTSTAPTIADDPLFLEGVRMVIAAVPVPHSGMTLAVRSDRDLRWRVFVCAGDRVGIGIARWRWLAHWRAHRNLA